VTSVVLGSPGAFKAEHSEGEPNYVYVKPIKREASQSNPTATREFGVLHEANECLGRFSVHSYSVYHPLLCATEYGRDDLLGISLVVSKGEALRCVSQRCRA
jgi:hypothetical protein